jgi:hypothetical protein
MPPQLEDQLRRWLDAGLISAEQAVLTRNLLSGRADSSGVSVPLDVVGGLIAGGALAAGIMVPRAGIAYGAVVGLAGLVLDIGIRNFHTATSIGVFLVLVGSGVVASLIAVTQALRARR